MLVGVFRMVSSEKRNLNKQILGTKTGSSSNNGGTEQSHFTGARMHNPGHMFGRGIKLEHRKTGMSGGCFGGSGGGHAWMGPLVGCLTERSERASDHLSRPEISQR